MNIFSLIFKERTLALFLYEVLGFLDKRIRFKKDQNISRFENLNKSTLIQQKTFEFITRTPFIDKIKVKKLRLLVNRFSNFLEKKSEKKLKIEIILCKIIDLSPKKFEELFKLIPNFIKIVAIQNLREFFKQYHSLIKTI
jgi:hypothetical protein